MRDKYLQMVAAGADEFALANYIKDHGRPGRRPNFFVEVPNVEYYSDGTKAAVILEREHCGTAVFIQELSDHPDDWRWVFEPTGRNRVKNRAAGKTPISLSDWKKLQRAYIQ